MNGAIFTLEQRDEISHAFDRGNYANAYEMTDLDECDLDDMKSHARAAFVLGFYSSYALHEIDDRETFDEAYFSDAGHYVVHIAHYCDDRAEEYAEEAGELLQGEEQES